MLTTKSFPVDKILLSSSSTVVILVIVLRAWGQYTADGPGLRDTALTAEQWAESLKCDSDELAGDKSRLTLSNLWHRLTGTICVRDTNAWRMRYAEEFHPSFKYLIKDRTTDERLANLAHTVSVHNIGNMSFVNFNSGNVRDDLRNEIRVAGPAVDNSICAQELAIMSNLYEDLQEKLREFREANKTERAQLSLEERHIRLARVLDSYGRYESGSLDGRQYFAGFYDECLRSQLTWPEADGRRMDMRYCWANMDIKRHLHPSLKSRRRFAHESAYYALKVAACLPKSCHSKSFHRNENRAIVQKLINSQLQLPDTIFVDKSLKLESIFCLVDDDSNFNHIPISGKVFLALVVGWIGLCIKATCSSLENDDHQKPTSLRQKLYKSLDIGQSWREFTSDRRQQDPNALIDLDVLNPIKLVACAICVFCHTALIIGSLSINSALIVSQVESSRVMMAGLLTSQFIDTFFVISGILAAYLSLLRYSNKIRARMDRKQVFSEAPAKIDAGSCRYPLDTRTFLGTCFELGAMRYLRIVPMYALFFWFQRDVYNFLGSGPFWDHGLNVETRNGFCRLEPWYSPFTFVAAYLQPAQQCFAVAWSISNDIFLALTTSPLILMFLHRPRLATKFILAFTLVSIIAAMDRLAMQSHPAILWEFLEFNLAGLLLQFTSLSPVYTWPFYRAPAFLIGALAGYHLFRYEDRKTGWPKWLTGPATKISCTYLAVHFVIAAASKDLKRPLWPLMRLFTFFNYTAERSIWSAAMAVIFLQMMTSWRSKPLMRHFASQGWRSMAKLTFAVIFIHYIVAGLQLHLLSAPPLFTLWNLAASFSLVLTVSFGIALIVHVAFENPMNKSIKLLMVSLVSRRPQKRIN